MLYLINQLHGNNISKLLKNSFTTVTLYFALIQPHINYRILAWGNATKYIPKRTVVLQKRTMRTICKIQYESHTEPLFRKLGILKIKNQFEYEITLFMNKYRKNNLPCSFNKLFVIIMMTMVD